MIRCTAAAARRRTVEDRGGSGVCAYALSSEPTCPSCGTCCGRRPQYPPRCAPGKDAALTLPSVHKYLRDRGRGRHRGRSGRPSPRCRIVPTLYARGSELRLYRTRCPGGDHRRRAVPASTRGRDDPARDAGGDRASARPSRGQPIGRPRESGAATLRAAGIPRCRHRRSE